MRFGSETTGQAERVLQTEASGSSVLCQAEREGGETQEAGMPLRREWEGSGSWLPLAVPA